MAEEERGAGDRVVEEQPARASSSTSFGESPKSLGRPFTPYTAAGAPKGRVLCQGWCYKGLAEAEGGQLLLLCYFWSQRP